MASVENLCEVIGSLTVEVWTSAEPLPFDLRYNGTYRKLEIGESWGGLFDCGWFCFSGEIPEWANPAELALRIDVNGELLVVDPQGLPIQALTNLSSQFARDLGTPEKLYLPLSLVPLDGRRFSVWADGGCNDLFGALQLNGALRFAELVRRPENIVKDYYDQRFLDETQKAFIEPESYPVYAVGHAHLDLGWLWPIRETRRKGVRTFATALQNMKKYPWYCFGASQPQLYSWVEESAPKILESVKQLEAEGRWELQGAMWVEADTHLPDGESLMRQFIYGQKYWRENFGHEVETVWLPDVFGYSGSIPGIARANNAKYVMTMKNAWNLFNQFPYNCFNWVGIDGSSVLTYRLPEETYNGAANPEAMKKCMKQDAQRSITQASAMLYGIGDGGAGPGEQHLEILQRITESESYPPVLHESTMGFFEKAAMAADSLPTHVGEMYLETHQGTFTSCEIIKKINRSYENKRQEIEFAAVCWNKPLPEWYEDFEKEVLLMQFHDILPGTSIERVYTEAAQRYAYWMEQCDAYLGKSKEAGFFNPTSESLIRFFKCGKSWNRLDLAPFACGKAEVWQGESPQILPNGLCNGILQVEFSPENGSIVSIRDLRKQSELLKNPAGMKIYTDKGNVWNIDPGTYDAPPLEGLVLENIHFEIDGPCAICRQDFRFENSRLQLLFKLLATEDYLEVEAHFNWQDPEHLIRFEVPSVLDSDTAQYANQFGYASFSTRNETSIEKAQYEIAAQRWCRLTDASGQGALALVSDCKYGFSVKNGQLNLSLLRSAERPGAFISKDDDAHSNTVQYNDLGDHDFTFAIVADQGNIAKVMDLAQWLNRPLPELPEWATMQCGQFIPWQPGQFGITMVRPAWEGEGNLIRIYERMGRPGVLSAIPDFHFEEVKPDGRPLEEKQDCAFHAFAIKTYRFVATGASSDCIL